MTQHHGQIQGTEDLLGLAAVFLVAAAVAGAFLLDHVPWLLPWALIAILLGLIAALVAGIAPGQVSGRVPILIAAAAAIIAAVTWAGGYGPGLNRDARRQLRARPAAAVAAYERQHTPHPARQRHRPARHPRHRRPPAHRPHRLTHQHRQARPAPSAAARLYGVKQLGRWHWQRTITGWSLLLGAPLALLGIAAGIGATRWRRRGPPASPRPPSAGAGRLRTAGRR